MSEKLTTLVDWTVFDKYPEYTVTCQCGAVYRTHVKMKLVLGVLIHFARKPCPICGQTQDHMSKVESDPEHWTVGG